MKKNRNKLLKNVLIRSMIALVILILTTAAIIAITYFIHEREGKMWIYIPLLAFSVITFLITFMSLVGSLTFYIKNRNEDTENFIDVKYLKVGLFYIDIISKINQFKHEVKEKNPSLQIECDDEWTDEHELS